MNKRKPGDYVVNAELTDAQIQRFVDDCVEAGCSTNWSDERFRYPLLRINTCDPGIISGDDWDWVEMDDLANNVTNEYKEPAMTDQPDLPTVLEECAEHLRAGRDPFRQFEAHDGGGWRQTLNYMELAAYAVNGNVRRKPQTITINGAEVPAPERVEPDVGSEVWLVSASMGGYPDVSVVWCGTPGEKKRLSAGQVYLNKSDRDQAAQAIIKALRGESNE